MEFDVDKLEWHLHVSKSVQSDELTAAVLGDFKLWCLGHNFDVVGAIMSVASLSWEKGYDAGITIADFTNRTGAANAAREYFESMAFLSGSRD